MAETQIPVTELDARYPTLVTRTATTGSLGAELRAAGLTGGQAAVILDRAGRHPEGGSGG